MAHFFKPPGNNSNGYDIDNKLAPGSVWRLRIPLGESRDIALFGGNELTVKSNNPNVLHTDLCEIDMVRVDRRTFRLSPIGEGTTMVESRDSNGAVWVALQVQCELNGGNSYLGKPVTGADATYAKRLMNFAPRSAELRPAHKDYLSSLVNKLRMNVVSDVFINGYAHDDANVGHSRASAVAAEFTRLAPWLAPNITISAVNDTPLRASQGGNDGYWRGVDILVYMEKKGLSPPPSPHKDETPPMPGPPRYFDWEVYAEWGCSFNPAPGVMISLNAYHFRLQNNHGHGVWCGSIQFGAGQSVELSKAFKLARLIKNLGVTRLISCLRNLPLPKKESILKVLQDFALNTAQSISHSDPPYSKFSAVTPFAASDLNGATASGGCIGGGEIRSYSSAYLNVTQKMPMYELKFMGTSTPPRWMMVRHATVNLLKDVDVGGWATGVQYVPSANASFVGGPLIVF